MTPPFPAPPPLVPMTQIRCEVVQIVVHEDRFGPTVREVGVTAVPGTRLAVPPDAFLTRYAHVVAVGEDRAQVLSDLEAPEHLVELRARPLSD